MTTWTTQTIREELRKSKQRRNARYAEMRQIRKRHTRGWSTDPTYDADMERLNTLRERNISDLDREDLLQLALVGAETISLINRQS